MQETPDFDSYDYIIVAFSGGKDSQACVLYLLWLGVPKEKIELWHHDIDGREGSTLMDWPITPDYCRKFAEALDLKIYFSWKEGGFEREMLRENSRTAPIHFETPDGLGSAGGTRGKESTRRKFPQVSADLSVRWCSAYLKIDVGSCALRNQPRFVDKRTLFITGERAEESAARCGYAVFEPDRADNRGGKRIKRHVDHWRPVHGWEEEKVWQIIQLFSINVHPAYRLGWGRVSCSACIFGSKDQFASLQDVYPEQVKVIADYEEEFGVTIKRKETVMELISKGMPYPDMDPFIVKEALGTEFVEPIILENWELPAGAYGESCGPT